MDDLVIRIPVGGLINVFLLRGEGGSVLVDTGPPGRADRIVVRLAAHGVAPDDIRLILITHGHTDHFGSAAALRERTGAPVAVHALDAEALRRGVHQPDSLKPTGRLMALAARFPVLSELAVPGRAPALEPDVVFDAEFRLHDYGVAGTVLHTPGHTPGSVSVLLESGEAVVGDMVMGGLLGLLHRPGPPVVAWDINSNRESLRRLLAFSPRIVYVTHGRPFEDPSALAALR